MEPTSRPLLLSLRPRFAEAILTGSKTVELRRTRVAAPIGTELVLYASSPVMSVVGVATLLGRESGTPDSIWRKHKQHAGVRRREYDEYFAGSGLATALSIGKAQALAIPYTLAWLRDEAAFQPPQSYRYLTSADPISLRRLAEMEPNQAVPA
ncbi:hypothetical protein [Saccharopolyspora sp. SCSIO 74807]|uniref:hypothetical protein n=1 Tax=Saccharopolyspora sp. SCSIO 74807 TaxID=3118084 RepID=UPI0030CCCD67